MQKVLITFGGRSYDETVAKTVEQAWQFGCDDVWVYDDRWLVEMSDGTRGFYNTNHWLWETKRRFGFGWCAWKPYIILDAMARLNKGDVVLYVDADTYPIADLSPIFQRTERDGLMVFACIGFSNWHSVRRDCFIAMGLDEPRFHNGQHACGRFCAFRVGDYLAQQLLWEWLAYSINPLCQQWEDYQSQYGPDLPGFSQHRTEQAVLSLLAAKYRLPLYREACDAGWPLDKIVQPPDETCQEYCGCRGIVWDLYPQLFTQSYCFAPKSLDGSRFRNVPLVGGLT